MQHPEASSSQTQVHTGSAEPVPGHSPWVTVAEGWAALHFEQASLVTLVLGALQITLLESGCRGENQQVRHVTGSQ